MLNWHEIDRLIATFRRTVLNCEGLSRIVLYPIMFYIWTELQTRYKVMANFNKFCKRKTIRRKLWNMSIIVGSEKREGITATSYRLLLTISQMFFGIRAVMINVKTLYFSFSKNLLLAVGLWPYQQSMLTQFQFIFIFCILISTIIFNVRSIYNIELILHNNLQLVYNMQWLKQQNVTFQDNVYLTHIYINQY